MYIPAKGSGGFGGSQPHHHAWGGAPAVAFVGGVNSDIVDGHIKDDAPVAQLYNLEEDKYQSANVYTQFPEVVNEMEATLETYKPKN